MGNVLTYLAWRGDLTLAQSGFNEVDNLILSTLCYLDFAGIVPPLGEGSLSLEQAARAYFARAGMPTAPREDDAGSEQARAWLLLHAAASNRFRRMRLSALRALLRPDENKQFCALCFHLNRRTLYLAYQGTTDDLAGWKEDFLLACVPEIPSQNEALRYFLAVSQAHPEASFILGGHSKGGNLAVYAAAQAPEALQSRILAVYSNDGPGFGQRFTESEGYRRIEGRVQAIVPRSSVVGMLLAHAERYRIVSSTQKGLLQHDGLSWEVLGERFITLHERTAQSIRSEQAIRDWLQTVPENRRVAFVDALFEILTAAGAQTLSEIRRDRLKTLAASLPIVLELPRDTREQLVEFLLLLGRITTRLHNESLRLQAEQRLENTALMRLARRSEAEEEID